MYKGGIKMDYLKIFEAINKRVEKIKKGCDAIDSELAALKKENEKAITDHIYEELKNGATQ